MKLASLTTTNSRDGELCVVNQTLTTAVRVSHLACTMQQALDNWVKVKNPLQEIYQALNAGKVPDSFAFDPCQASAPLPRALQWLDGSAYVNHVELVRKARKVEMPANFWTDPLMYQGCSDSMLGPCEDIALSDENFGIDFEAEISVITDDVPMGVTAEEAVQHIKLLMLVNDVSLRNLATPELTKGFGFVQSKPASSFSPVAITPDELGDYWRDCRVHLPLCSYLNGNLFGKPNAGVDMTFSFAQLIAHAAKTRHLAAGTIIGSGTVSNSDRSNGSSCIIERRMLETITQGQAVTDYMHFGDKVRIEMLTPQGQSLFGAIDQTVVPYER